MIDPLEVLREVDAHLARLTRADVPGQIPCWKKTKNGQVNYNPDNQHWEIWRQVQRAIKELENDRKRLRSGAATGEGGSHDRPAPAPANHLVRP